MSDKDYIVFVEDMVEAIDKILSYLESVNDLAGFLNNNMAIDAVTRNYEIIGEASKKVPSALKDKYPEVPWRQMYGLRNFAVHEYHIIDPRILWDIAEKHLVNNKAALEELLENEK